MAATLKKLTSKTNTVKVAIDGDPEAVTVEYTTRKLTARVQAEIEEFIREGMNSESTIKQFLSLAVAWDLRPDDGQPPVPLTEDGLKDVPLEVLGEIVEAITNDIAPKETTATS